MALSVNGGRFGVNCTLIPGDIGDVRCARTKSPLQGGC